jgi:hypothetical protein
VLKGYQASDVVMLGECVQTAGKTATIVAQRARLTSARRYQGFSTFGAISYCNSPDFNGVDGILGFGLPVAALARAPVDPSDPFGGQRRSEAPRPLLLASFRVIFAARSC